MTKLNPTGTGLVYSTFLGPVSWFGEKTCIALDANTNVYVAGKTGGAPSYYPPAFPLTPGAYQTEYHGGYYGDVFVTKLDPSGTGLVFSTLLGGRSSESPGSIAVDASGKVYVVGLVSSYDSLPPQSPSTATFPVTADAVQKYNYGGDAYAPNNAFITVFSPGGDRLLFSSYLGGSESDLAAGVGVDPAGNVYVAGYAGSTDFPEVMPAGSKGAFLARIGFASPAGQVMLDASLRGVPITVAGAEACSPGRYSAPVTLNWKPGALCAVTVGDLIRGPGRRQRFVRWSDGSTANPRGFAAPAVPTTWTADVFRDQYSLTLAVRPPGSGSIVASPGSADGFYVTDTIVQLTAVPAPGYTFAGWSGDITGAINRQSVRMSSATSVTASFAPTSCTYGVLPSTAAFSAAAQRGTVQVTAAAGCPWSATSNSSWIQSVAPAAGSGNGAVSFVLAANPGAAPRMGSILIGSRTVPVTQAGTMQRPYFVDVSPIVGSGVSQTFTFTWADVSGAQEISQAYMLWSSALSPAAACYLEYNRANQTLRLMNDAGTAWLGPVQAGIAGILRNSQCAIDAGAVSASSVNERLTFSVPVTFQARYPGRKNIYSAAVGNAGVSSSWMFGGSWWPGAKVANAVPRYRIYNPFGGAHLYTTDANEYAVLSARGFVPEGATSRIYDAPATVSGVAALPYYRLYHIAARNHYWTTDRSEFLALARDPNYSGEGVDGFVLPAQAGTAIPLYCLEYSPASVMHWTEDAVEYAALGTQGWAQKGADAYVLPLGAPQAPRSQPAPSLTIVNAASQQEGPIARGEMIRIVGSGFGSEGAVTVGSVAAQVLSRSDREIVAIVPETGDGTVAVGGIQNTIPLTAASPALFTAGELGRGDARVDGQASPGAIVSVFLTGCGAGMPVSATVGGLAAGVAGASESAPGVADVRIRVPEDLGAGRHDVTVHCGEFMTQMGVALPVANRPGVTPVLPIER